MPKLTLRFFQFLAIYVIVSVIDRINRLPRRSGQPEVMRILRENLALKAQVEVLRCELKCKKGKRPRVSLSTRAAQVFAFLITGTDRTFQKYYLTASVHTLRSWASWFRVAGLRRTNRPSVGRPPISREVIELIVKLKRENPQMGLCKLRHTLLLMGIKVSETSIRKILEYHGIDPYSGPRNWDRFKSAAKDAIWAADYFFRSDG